MSSVIEVVALALQRKSDQRYMIARRGPEETGAGDWEFPGGKIDAMDASATPAETQKQALVREIEEEFSFTLNKANLVFVASADYHQPQRIIRLHLWTCLVDVEPEVKLVDHDQISWCFPSEMSDFRISAADLVFIPLLNE